MVSSLSELIGTLEYFISVNGNHELRILIACNLSEACSRISNILNVLVVVLVLSNHRFLNVGWRNNPVELNLLGILGGWAADVLVRKPHFITYLLSIESLTFPWPGIITLIQVIGNCWSLWFRPLRVSIVAVFCRVLFESWFSTLSLFGGFDWFSGLWDDPTFELGIGGNYLHIIASAAVRTTTRFYRWGSVEVQPSLGSNVFSNALFYWLVWSLLSVECFISDSRETLVLTWLNTGLKHRLFLAHLCSLLAPFIPD